MLILLLCLQAVDLAGLPIRSGPETRAIATDAWARKKFRCYWSFFSPGIIVIRWALLTPVKREAERRAREQKM